MDSLKKLGDNLVVETQKILRRSKTEEDLRIGFEKILEPVLKDLGIKPSPQYERTIFKAGRPDALHGQVVIEYEPPHAFQSQKSIEHAREQLIGYIQGLTQAEKDELFVPEIKFIGIGFDGEQIFFVRSKGEKKKPKTELGRDDFVLVGPYPFDQNSAYTLLTHLRALSRLPLTAENLAEKFGPQSKIATAAVSALVDAFQNWSNERVKVFFDEWKRLFGIVYGEQFSSQQEIEAAALSSLYGISKDKNFQEMLFAVHTYFAFLMKLIAAEIIYLRESSMSSSFSGALTHSPQKEFEKTIADMEDGGIYARKGVTNFLEGDFFRWYLEALPSPRLQEAFREISRQLSDFEPATSSINPASARDLLKKLYQYLVPPEIRHKLGEYYTPDWLAELIINEVGYDGNTLDRFLDPACGSGTFLVLAIQRAQEYGQKHKEPLLETAKRIVANIWGFDLNPLAVIASRTNYLFALGNLAAELSHFEIPVYLADSVLWPERAGQLQLNFAGGENIKIQTSIGEFHIPNIWIKNKGFLMQKAAPIVEQMAKQNYSPEEAMARFEKEGLVFPPHQNVVQNFYKEILKFEKQGKNGIWARFLKNIFAPVMAGQFDYVVGNPPWIIWNYLSYEYRRATGPMWRNYGLSAIKESKDRLSSGKLDFSMLFLYASSDYYLRNEGKLGFLITQEVMKSKGAGEGFRHFKIGEKGKQLKVLKAHDFVTIQPFEGAANKSAAIILKKGKETTYPVPYFLWKRKRGIGKIPTNLSLGEATSLLTKTQLYAQPIGSKYSSWQTASRGAQRYLKQLKGRNIYTARIGARLEPYGIFWLKLEQVFSEGSLLVANMTEKGKKQFAKISSRVEPDVIYPSLRGADIERWGCKPEIFILVTHNPKTPTKAFSESIMRQDFPMAYSYLLRFKNDLLERAAYEKFHLKSARPFYSQFNISRDTFKKYKVAWKRMTNDIYACVISQIKTPFGYKMIIPMDTCSFIGLEEEDGAYYLCSILNSVPIRDFIKSFSSAGRGFGTPSVIEHIGMPQFDSKNKVHQQLASLSKKCHQLTVELAEKKEAGKIDLETGGVQNEIVKFEKEIDSLVKRLFGIT